MAITVELPGALRPHARGNAAVVIDRPCGSVREVLRELAARWPGVLDRVVTEQGELRPHVNVFVGEENSRFMGGLAAGVPDGSVVTILPAVSGG